ncbi:hypothetical protein ACFL3H_01195 [Gemmatimonadota bacterium]
MKPFNKVNRPRLFRGLLAPALLLAGLSLLFITGCEKDPAGPSNADIEAAKTLIDEGFVLLATAFENVDPSSQTPADFLTPKGKFEDALEFDSDNQDARVGLALCEIGLLTQDATLLAAIGGIIPLAPFGKAVSGDSPPGFRRALGDITGPGEDILSPGGWLTWMQDRMTKVVQEGPAPDLEPLQTAVETVIIPVVDAVIALLAVVETDVTWTKVLTPQMQGFEDLEGQLEIDVTDILMVDAFMQVLKSQLHFFVSYNLNFPDFQSETSVVAALNQTDGTFLALRTNGTTNMGSVRTSLLAAITKMRLFGLNLSAESDDQTDDLIKIDPTGGDGPNAEDLIEIATRLTELESILNGPSDVDDVDFDGDGSPDVLSVDLSSIFTTPIQDLKQLLPPYSWNAQYTTFLWNGWPEDISQFVFPDPTMGGILPGLTTDAGLKAFFGIPTDYWITPGPFFFGAGG